MVSVCWQVINYTTIVSVLINYYSAVFVVVKSCYCFLCYTQCGKLFQFKQLFTPDHVMQVESCFNIPWNIRDR